LRSACTRRATACSAADRNRAGYEHALAGRRDDPHTAVQRLDPVDHVSQACTTLGERAVEPPSPVLDLEAELAVLLVQPDADARVVAGMAHRVLHRLATSAL